MVSGGAAGQECILVFSLQRSLNAMSADIDESDKNLVGALERTRQRIEVLKKEFREATAKLTAVNDHIKSATEKYSALRQVNDELEQVNKTLELATTKLTAITERLADAQREAERLERAKQELDAVNDALTVSTKKLAAVNKELKEAVEHVETLQEAELQLQSVNRDVTKANDGLAAINRDLKIAHELAKNDAKLKAEFLANMSHEIRTPMSGMIGMCEMLLLGNLDDDSREMAMAISQSAEDLLSIVNQLLDFSKLEAGKMQPERITFSITAVLEKVIKNIQPDAAKKGLAIKKVVGPKIPASVVGDGVRVEKILLNLAHNAVKFTEHGEIRIEADVLTESKPPLTLRISVTDTGIGISETARKNLFEPFVQADGSTTRIFGGTGLGLSIAKRLVSLLSGQIGITSTEGKGSTFWFSVPLECANE